LVPQDLKAGSVEDYVILAVAKRIAGDIAYSSDPASALRRWREYFGASQYEVAKVMGVTASVVSDYEKGRRSPGVKFIKRFVDALLKIDAERGWVRVKSLSRGLGIPPGVVLDMREFSRPLSVAEVAELVSGVVLSPDLPVDKRVYGYTVVDSIKAIASLSGTQFYSLLGSTTERAVVFTNVRLGRSPMVAVRVSPIKPGVVVIHGPRRSVDPLAVELARLEGIPLILSLARSIEELVNSLRRASEAPSLPPLSALI